MAERRRTRAAQQRRASRIHPRQCDLIVDGNTVYWTERARGEVLAMSLE